MTNSHASLAASTSNVLDFQRERRLRRASQGTADIEGSQPEASTAPALVASQAQRAAAAMELASLAGSVGEDTFEAGMENYVTRKMDELVGKYGALLVDALSSAKGTMHTALFAEILRAIGRADDAVSREQRFWFLAYSLRDAQPEIRSAAALGLGSLEDPRASTYLQQAAEDEPFELLRTRLSSLAAELAAKH